MGDNKNKQLWLVIVCALLLQGVASANPQAFYFTWIDDPTSTMCVDWHVMPGQEPPALEYRKVGLEAWERHQGEELKYPFSDRRLFRQQLTGLEEDTEYDFRFGEGDILKFKTMPKILNRTLRVAIGGDARHRKEWMVKTAEVAASHDPDFAIIGGDMAYEDGRSSKINQIYEFFDAYTEAFRTVDGRVIPLLVCVGNHEVAGGYVNGMVAELLEHHGIVSFEKEPERFRDMIAPYFYALFAFPGQPGYATLDVGDYLSLIFLDTQHTNPIPGVQTRWLEEQLKSRAGGKRHVIPVYHVPAFPSHRNFDEWTSRMIRENWLPLFEKYAVKVAFENHDHTYKRTVPIRAGKEDPSGITYIGDGAWGVGTRDVHDPATTWYLEKAQSVRHVIILEVEADGLRARMYSEDGDEIDRWQAPR